MSKDKEDYIHIVENATDIPIFYQPWWLDTLAQEKQWDAVIARDKKDKITGIWPFIIQKKWGLKISPSLILTPFLGPLFFYPSNQLKNTKRLSFENKTLGTLAKALKKHNLNYFCQFLSPQVQNGIALQWEGIKEQTFYRSIIYGIKDIEKTRKGFKSNKKNYINKFHKSNIIIESESIDELYPLMIESFKRRNTQIVFSKELFEDLHHLVSNNNASKVYYAVNDNKEIIAGIYIVLSQDVAYLIATGFSGKQNDAVTALIAYAIEDVAQYANSFDFCGSMIPGISSFFQDFGGELHRYSMLKYFSNPVIETLYTLSQIRNKLN